MRLKFSCKLDFGFISFYYLVYRFLKADKYANINLDRFALCWSAPEIDAQHKTLIINLNELFDAMKEGKANTMLRFLLNKLVAYTQMHFSTEEKYMKQWNYSEYANHKAEHVTFVINKVADFED